jgi:hypothetical protein
MYSAKYSTYLNNMSEWKKKDIYKNFPIINYYRLNLKRSNIDLDF